MDRGGYRGMLIVGNSRCSVGSHDDLLLISALFEQPDALWIVSRLVAWSCRMRQSTQRLEFHFSHLERGICILQGGCVITH